MGRYSETLINMTDIKGMSLLYKACYYKKDDVVELLIQYPGIDVNVKTINSKTAPLHLATNALLTNIVRKLLGHPCIVYDPKEDVNKTPLDLIKQQIEELKDSNRHDKKQMISECIKIKNFLEDFPFKQRWQAFVYLLSNFEQI